MKNEAPLISRLGLRLTPHGRLLLDAAEDAPILEEKVAARLGEAFAQGSGYGLMRLAGEVGQMLPPTQIWWRDFASRYVGETRGKAGDGETSGREASGRETAGGKAGPATQGSCANAQAGQGRGAAADPAGRSTGACQGQKEKGHCPVGGGQGPL